jgi:hypothetical protein
LLWIPNVSAEEYEAGWLQTEYVSGKSRIHFLSHEANHQQFTKSFTNIHTSSNKQAYEPKTQSKNSKSEARNPKWFDKLTTLSQVEGQIQMFKIQNAKERDPFSLTSLL